MKILNILFYLITCVLAFIASGCSSDSGNSTTTDTAAPIAKVFISHNYDGEIVSVIGESSVGTQESFVITTTDANDATPNIIESGEVGVIEITECDVLWEMSYRFFFPADPTNKLTIVNEMKMYSCDTEYSYTCLRQVFDFFDEEIDVSQCTFKQLSKVC